MENADGERKSRLPTLKTPSKFGLTATQRTVNKLKRRSINISNGCVGPKSPRLTGGSAVKSVVRTRNPLSAVQATVGRATLANPREIINRSNSNIAARTANSGTSLTGRTSGAQVPGYMRSRQASPRPSTSGTTGVGNSRPPVSGAGLRRTSSTTVITPAQLEEKQAKIDSLEEKNAELEEKLSAKCAEWEEKMHKKEERIVKLESDVERKEASLELCKERLECKDLQIERKEQKIEKIEQDLAAAKEANAKLKEENVSLERIKETQEQEIASLIAEVALLTEKKGTIENELLQNDQRMRLLLNNVVDLKGQIRVAVRVRPTLPKEIGLVTDHINYASPTCIKLDTAGKWQTFEFQRVFGPNLRQSSVFDEVHELIESCLHGYNVSIIAYGQTGSGKTHTMRGGEGEAAGIIPRAVAFLFDAQKKLADIGWTFEFSASFLEIYNEEVMDLLAKRKKLEVKIGSGAIEVPDLTAHPINGPDDIDGVLAVADRHRSTASTACNEHSSRSHAIFELKLNARNEKLGQTLCSSLHLVDLAGSERAKETQAAGDRFKEMTHINHGLSTLQNCIRGQMNKAPHIPYRDSKLTMLLKNSLGGGNSKTMVVVALNPAPSAIGDTKRSLEIAQQMSNTKIGAAVKHEK